MSNRLTIGLFVTTLGMVIYTGNVYIKHTENNYFDLRGSMDTIRQSDAVLSVALRDNIDDLISQDGIENTIRIVREFLVNKEINVDQCHSVLHIAGHIAYEYEHANLANLVRSDNNMCIGSFHHGVEAQISFTEDYIGQLRLYCNELRKKFPGINCYHGAGHGFMETADGNALKALKMCDNLDGGPENDLTDCYRGVFSEYGNRALGYDGDTSLPLPPSKVIKLDLSDPYSFCKTFDEKYRESCFSQLTKVFVNSDDISDSINQCLDIKHEEVIKLICVRIVSGVITRTILSRHDTTEVHDVVLNLQPEFKKAYISGLAEALAGFRNDGLLKDYKHICESFEDEEDERYCLDTLSKQ